MAKGYKYCSLCGKKEGNKSTENNFERKKWEQRKLQQPVVN